MASTPAVPDTAGLKTTFSDTLSGANTSATRADVVAAAIAAAQAETKRALERADASDKRADASDKRVDASDAALRQARSENAADRAIAYAQHATMRSHAEASSRHSEMISVVSDNVFFNDLATGNLDEARRGWSALRAEKLNLPSVKDDEKPLMHDLLAVILKHALQSAQASSDTKLVLFHERKAKINDSQACVVPDWVAAHWRDCSFCMHAMLFGLEAKNRKPENTGIGQAQGVDYALRRASYLDEQLNNAGARGRSKAYTAFSNGESVQFFSVHFSRLASDPAPVVLLSTSLLELIPLAVFQGGALPTEPTPGFVALVRMLSSSAAQLGESAALESSVDLPDHRGVQVLIELGRRVALGGFCDVYEGKLPNGEAVAVKLPRYRSAQVRADVANEASALDTLRLSAGSLCPNIPRLVLPAVPPRTFSRRPVVRAAAGASRDMWDPALDNSAFPAGLASQPLGTPLAQVMAELLDRDFASAAAANALMAALANHVSSGLHSALCHARGAGLLHADLRPQNVVLVAGSRSDWLDSCVVLVDWALAMPLGSRHATSRNGVAAYLHDDLAVPGSPWTARPKHDLCALAYTAATVACGTTNGHHVATPWCGLHFAGSGSDAVLARAAWLQSGAPVARQCAAFIAAVEAWDTTWQSSASVGPGPPQLRVSNG